MNELHDDASSLSLSTRYTVALDTARAIAGSRYGGWNATDREDLVSEVMIKYWLKFGQHGEPDRLRAWLATVIVTTAISMNRAQERRPSVPKGDMIPVQHWLDGWLGTVDHVGPGKTVASRELIAEVLGLVSKPERDLLTFMYLDRRSTTDVAHQLGKTTGATSQAVHRAKEHLLEALAEQPGLLEELRAPMPRAH
jgi:RNA polymerase sigma factor (sigma-70 family)